MEQDFEREDLVLQQLEKRSASLFAKPARRK